MEKERGNWVKWLSNIVVVLSFFGALISLIIGVSNLVSIDRNDKMIVAQQAEILELKELAKATNARLSITKPEHGEVIASGYNKMEGTIYGDIPDGYELWTIAKNEFNYYIMYPQTEHIYASNEWKQTNIQLGDSDEWELCVCLADKETSDEFRRRVSESDYSGLEKLPEGVSIVDYVAVIKTLSFDEVFKMVKDNVTIETPIKTISAATAFTVSGSMEVELPDGYSLIAVASEDSDYFNYSNYYFMQPNIMIGDGGVWTGNNCQLSEKGIWNMSVCLLDNTDGMAFVNDTGYTGIGSIPEDVNIKIIDTCQIIVE